MIYVLLLGDVLDGLKLIDDNSINCIVTSPPYWGLRFYGEEANKVWDGDANCEHEFEYAEDKRLGGVCKKCGAWYGQLGLEPTLEMYLAHLLQVTAECKRVLRKDGVMWWNHGDCYGGSQQGQVALPNVSLPPKCMVMQNYRLILKMIEEQGWILRNIVIWHKKSHMPESVKDRLTKAYEPVFMLTKSKKYFFDLDAIREPHTTSILTRVEQFIKNDEKYSPERHKTPEIGQAPFVVLANAARKGLPLLGKNPGDVWLEGNESNSKYANADMYFGHYPLKCGSYPLGQNPGDVWSLSLEPFPDAHFAVFPRKLVERPLKATCPEWVCNKCGKIRERIVKEERKSTPRMREPIGEPGKPSGIRSLSGSTYNYPERYTIGFTDCGCNAGWHAGWVLDPFLGSGTVFEEAMAQKKNAIGIEINPKYAEMVKKRLQFPLYNAPFSLHTLIIYHLSSGKIESYGRPIEQYEPKELAHLPLKAEIKNKLKGEKGES